jgi:serine/threonine-protein kinase
MTDEPGPTASGSSVPGGAEVDASARRGGYLLYGSRIGPYEVARHLASGGMAAVYQVWHTGLHRYEAMKVPHPELRHDPEFLRRFFQEARMAAGLQHPHIVGILGVSEAFGGGAAAGSPESYFTMEYVEGGDLHDLVHQHGRFTLAESIPLLRDIADALDYAHSRGIIHRDVKPSNVLMRSDSSRPGGFLPKVTDFGIARAATMGADGESRAQRLTKTGSILGTPAFLSPEQAGSGAAVGPASDQYSLGVIAYLMLAGRAPFPWNPDAPYAVLLGHLRDTPPPFAVGGATRAATDAANQAIGRALAKDPEERFPHCRGLVDALADCGSSTARTITAPEPRRSRAAPPSTAKPPAAAPPSTARPDPDHVLPPTTARKPLAAPMPPSPPQPVDAEVIAAAEKALAKFIGPLARVLVKRRARTAADRAEFHRLLADELSTEAEKAEFLRTVRADR